MVEMELLGLRVEPPSNTPIALLREREGAGRVLPIFIGNAEATAIAFALEEVETPRPLTHDLLKDLLEAMGALLVSVSVTELLNGTFYAELELSTAAGARKVSCRPSDGIALALRAKSPILVSEAVLDEAGQVPEIVGEGDGEDAEQVVEEFKDFIEHVNPEDFAS
jgi:bifunctional DNase/RNase